MKNNHRQLARTAHDVRHLCLCTKCAELADDRDTVRPIGASEGQWHPACFYQAFGETAVLKQLTREQQNKFRMCDAPVAVLKKLVAAA